MKSLESLVKQLIEYPTEEGWFEFKENWYDATQIGEYISALSNAAALSGKEYAYLVWGVKEGTRELVNTSFNFRKDVKGEPLEHFLARQIVPDTHFEFHEITINKCRIVVLLIPAARQVPTSFNNSRYMRIGSSKVKLSKYPER